MHIHYISLYHHSISKTVSDILSPSPGYDLRSRSQIPQGRAQAAAVRRQQHLRLPGGFRSLNWKKTRGKPWENRWKTMITMGIWWENILESNDFLFRLAFLFGLFLNAKVGK